MFTGLIQDIGRVKAVTRTGGGMTLSIEHSLKGDIAIGDSIAVNGICLTAETVGDGSFTAHAVRETLTRSSLASLHPGSKVNLELALRAGDRLGGHHVQGHVDTIGRISRSYPQGTSRLIEIKFPPKYIDLVVPEGSIAIDGVSLTIKEVHGGPSVIVSVIPETLKRTTIKDIFPGRTVNIEFDVLGKYALKRKI